MYLPSGNLTNYEFPWGGQTIRTDRNAICGSGGSDQGGMNLSVFNTNFTNPRLRIYTGSDTFLESNIVFPLNTWTKVRVEHNNIITRTNLFIDDVLVGFSNTLVFPNISYYGNFFIGGRDDNVNGQFNQAWRGYISDFKLYSTSPQPCP